jgi:PAS domain-containing protein
VFDAEGRFSGYRGVASDLTDRKRAEQALQRSEAYLAEAQRLSHTGSWGWNAATRELTHWSQEIYGLYGPFSNAAVVSCGSRLLKAQGTVYWIFRLVKACIPVKSPFNL